MKHLVVCTLVVLVCAACDQDDDWPMPDADGDGAVEIPGDTGGDTPADLPGDTPTDTPTDTTPDTPPGDCNLICGTVAAPEPGTGLASFAPPGCAGGNFTYSWGTSLVNDAGKSVPIVAFLDTDGDADIFVNPRLSSSAHVYAGTGTGTFGSATLLPAGGMFAGGWGGDVGDFNGDGRLDLVVGDHVAGAIAWSNGGSMSFSLATTGLPSDTLQGAGFADLNGDGNLDAVFGADQFSSGFVVRHGNGSGTWTDPGVTGIPGLGAGSGANNGWINASDLDGDGDVDIVGFGQIGGGLAGQVFFNSGDGVAFTGLDVGGGGGGSIGSPVQGAIGDVNCDGTPDLAVGGRIYLGSGSSFSPGATADDSKLGQLGDLNGDGYLDLVTHHESHGLRAFLNDGTGSSFTETDLGLPDQTWTPPAASGTVTTPLDTPYGFDLADVNGDEVLDIVRVVMVRTGMGSAAILEVWTR
ncbi:MAG: VCBS repeat-containing protein [Deltaproteobacteria bacterium]|nr:VCBS repeat-containing protein [Deltaproteobacteria bacterium]